MRVGGAIVGSVVAVCVAGSGLGVGPAAAAPRVPTAPSYSPTALEAMSITIDATTEQSPAAWTVGNESAMWTPSFGTATYGYAMPSSIPATGTTATIHVTSHANSGSRFDPGLQLKGNMVASDAAAEALAESDQSSSAEKVVTLQPEEYTIGSEQDLLVGITDGPTITVHYKAVGSSTQCPHVPRGCPTSVTPLSTPPVLGTTTTYAAPAAGKTEALPLPALPADATKASVAINATDASGKAEPPPVVGGMTNAGKAYVICYLLMFSNDDSTIDAHGREEHPADSYSGCIAAVLLVLQRHDQIVAAQSAHVARVRFASACRTKLFGPARHVKVTCARTAHGVTVSLVATGGQKLAAALGPHPRLIVARTKVGAGSKAKQRVKVLWHASH